jgi:dTDP-4-amino-4,6-dideoxygalactose transaminase
MTEMQAAIGRIQLQKLTCWLEKRRKNAAIYDSYIDEISMLTRTIVSSDYEHSYYKYYIYTQSEDIQQHLLIKLNEKNIPCNVGICPDLSKETVFKNYGTYGPFNNAKILGQTGIALPVYPTMDEEHVHFIGKQLKELMLHV